MLVVIHKSSNFVFAKMYNVKTQVHNFWSSFNHDFVLKYATTAFFVLEPLLRKTEISYLATFCKFELSRYSFSYDINFMP